MPARADASRRALAVEGEQESPRGRPVLLAQMLELVREVLEAEVDAERGRVRLDQAARVAPVAVRARRPQRYCFATPISLSGSQVASSGKTVMSAMHSTIMKKNGSAARAT